MSAGFFLCDSPLSPQDAARLGREGRGFLTPSTDGFGSSPCSSAAVRPIAVLRSYESKKTAALGGEEGGQKESA
jgi:hypothetical protein